ncbi:MAG: hypothetical protein HQL52_05995 [Magnetococcales bacterium]|nr:hypothetical protein [Magnetococcales bacterium]
MSERHLEEPENGFQARLGERVAALGRSTEKGAQNTPLQRLAERLLGEGSGKISGQGGRAFRKGEKKLLKKIKKSCPQVSRSLLRAILCLRDPAREAAALAWLCGEGLDPGQAALLDMPYSKKKLKGEKREGEARERLASLNCLLDAYALNSSEENVASPPLAAEKSGSAGNQVALPVSEESGPARINASSGAFASDRAGELQPVGGSEPACDSDEMGGFLEVTRWEEVGSVGLADSISPGRIITLEELVQACGEDGWWQKPTRVTAASPGGEIFKGDFKRITTALLQWLIEQPAQNTPIKTREELWQVLFSRFARERLTELRGDPRNIPGLHHLGRSLKSFCARLATLSARSDWFRCWQDLYPLWSEQNRLVRFRFGGVAVRVRGDGLLVRLHPSHGLEVVACNPGYGERSREGLLKMAVMARLLKVLRPDIPLIGTLEHYEPNLWLEGVSEGELEALFSQRVLPVLKEIAAKA